MTSQLEGFFWSDVLYSNIGILIQSRMIEKYPLFIHFNLRIMHQILSAAI